MYLGIDLGTSSVKVVLLNDEQEVIGQHSQPLTVSQPKPLWSEQDPEHWWQATREAMRQLKKQYSKSLGAVKAIGLSGQQHGATLLDKSQKVLRPAMLWNDGRAMAQCKTLSLVDNHADITGSAIMAGFTAPKVLWVSEHEPEIFKQIDKVLLPKDYLRLRMTGDYATDLSDASGTAWLDVGKRNWSDAMLAATGLTQDHMPKLHEGSQITGTLSASIANEWGMQANTVVVGGGGDNPAGAISMNVIKPGSAFLSLGTSGVYFVASHSYQPNAAGGIHTFCHCLPEQWHYMSVHLSAASCLSWLANTLQVASTKELLLEAEKNFTTDSHSPVIFLPYLSGERTPHGNPHAKGLFFGMTHSTNRSDLTRAVLEGVAFAFADGQDAMLQANVVIDDVSVVGGGAKSLFWGKILAAALQRPLNYRVNREVGSALGAARLGFIAANNLDPLTAFVMPPVETVIEPDPELVNAYVKKQQVFRKLYLRLEDMFETV
jgi:xylulokinase